MLVGSWLQDFAVGVVDSEGQYRLIDSGPLPEAVAASAAIPFIFEPVDVPGKLACARQIACCRDDFMSTQLQRGMFLVRQT